MHETREDPPAADPRAAARCLGLVTRSAFIAIAAAAFSASSHQWLCYFGRGLGGGGLGGIGGLIHLVLILYFFVAEPVAVANFG